MTQRPLALLALLALAAPVPAQEDLLDREPRSSLSKALRKKGEALWQSVAKAADGAKARKEIPADEARKVLATLEDAALKLERSLQAGWSTEANAVLAQVVRAWAVYKAHVPAEPLPEDPEAREKAEKARVRARKSRIKAARRAVMDMLSARRYEKLFRRCDRCDGRGDLSSRFGDKQPCPKCRRRGNVLDSKAVLKAHWLVYSPLFRADSRSRSRLNRTVRTAHTNLSGLQPFPRSGGIRGPLEDHGDWARVRTRERIYLEPGAKRTETIEGVYTLFRVGKLWYLYTERYDKKILEIPAVEEEEADKTG